MEKNKTYKQRFMDGFKILLYSRNSYEVWFDLMSVFAIEISNTVTRNMPELKEVWETREKEYIRIMKKYSEKERKIIVQMFSLMVLELEQNPDQDFLGETYMSLGIGNKDAGQFFTPYSVCKAMASITIDKPMLRDKVKKQGFVSVNDCACGAGATLIAAVSQCKELFNRLNFQNHVYFVAQDVDVNVARMCYIQLSLLGVAAIIKVGNTLTNPGLHITKENANSFYFTPVWFSDVWTMRRLFYNFDLCMNKIERK